MVMLTLWRFQKGIQTGTYHPLYYRENVVKAFEWYWVSPPVLNHNKCKLWTLWWGWKWCVRVFCFRGHPWHFTRPLSTGNSAKQELEQFKVNINRSSHKQLKIILTSEEGEGGWFHWENFFSFHFLCSCSHVSIISFPSQKELYYLLSAHLKEV